MPALLTDIIRRVRSKLNEPATPTSSAGSPSFYTDTEITDWINDGLRDIARAAENLIVYETGIQIPPYTPIPGVITAYPLPSDIIRINRVEFIPLNSTSQSYKVQQSTQNEMDQMWGTWQQDSSSYPSFWVARGYPGGQGRAQFAIQLYPNVSQGGNLILFYYRLPKRLPDPVANSYAYNLPLDLNEGWDDMVVDYAYAQGLVKARDPAWQGVMQIYNQKLAYLIDVTRNAGDQPSYMQPGMLQGVPYWLYGTGM